MLTDDDLKHLVSRSGSGVDLFVVLVVLLMMCRDDLYSDEQCGKMLRWFFLSFL